MIVRNVVDVRVWLLERLNAVVSPEVLEADKGYFAAANKTDFLNALDPKVLGQYNHYCWMRQEAEYLGEQVIKLDDIARDIHQANLDAKKATEIINTLQKDYREIKKTEDIINQVQNTKTRKQPGYKDTILDEAANITNSIDLVIHNSAQNSMPFSESIKNLSKVCLQIVGTEHPTDPLSQKARDKLTLLTETMTASQPENATVENIFHDLLHVDPIPKQSRSVVEEVGRDVAMTLNRMYDALGPLINSILDAYRKYYPRDFAARQDEIWVAIRKIVRDVTWAACDADGNVNVTFEGTENGMRIRRLRITEKHITTLDIFIIKKIKQIERDYRDKISQVQDDCFNKISELARQLTVEANKFQTNTNKFIRDRCIDDLIDYCKNTELDKTAEIAAEIQRNKDLTRASVYQSAEIIKKLTALSGVSRSSPQGKDELGVLQSFRSIFTKFKSDIQKETHAIRVESETKGESSKNISEFVVDKYNQIMQEHAEIINQFPELKHIMQCFDIQLRCYGMSYGAAHIRQDSTVYIAVWNTLLEDLKTDPKFADSEVFKLLANSTYKNLKPEQRAEVQTLLQDPKNEAVLKEIYDRRKDPKIYLSGDKYQTPEFDKVRTELDRMLLAIENDDMFENTIISNCENFANILEVISLKMIFPLPAKHLAVVPLLEKREDLQNAIPILTAYSKLLITQKIREDVKSGVRPPSDLDAILNPETSAEFIQNHEGEFKSLVIEVMFGYSDTERVSGLTALLDVLKARESFVKLANQFGLTPKIFHGQGGDLLRGGLHYVVTKGTGQGEWRNLVIGSAAHANLFRQKQFAVTYNNIAYPSLEFDSLPEHLQQALNTFCQEGAEFYEHVQNTHTGYGNLVALIDGLGPYCFVGSLNSSSRANIKHGGKQNHSDRTAAMQEGGKHPSPFEPAGNLRAITVTQINEMLCGYFHILVGPGRALRNMDPATVKLLYWTSDIFREMYLKLAYGLAMADLEIAKIGYFHGNEDLLYKTPEQRRSWARECEKLEPGSISEAAIRDMLKAKESGDTKALETLAKFFSLFEDEFFESGQFMFDINHAMYPEYYEGKTTFTAGIDLLRPFPQWHAQVGKVLHNALPSVHQLALMNKHIANGGKIDTRYPGLIREPNEKSDLTGIAYFISEVEVSASTRRRMIFPWELKHPVSQAGVMWANKDCVTRAGFFEDQKNSLINEKNTLIANRKMFGFGGRNYKPGVERALTEYVTRPKFFRDQKAALVVEVETHTNTNQTLRGGGRNMD